MTKLCYIMVGVSGSGKSTAVDKLLNMNPHARVFSLDRVRVQMFEMSMEDASNVTCEKDLYAAAFNYVNANQKEFDANVTAAWGYALKGDTVIVDNTNLTRKSRARWIQEARSKGFTIVAVNVMAPLSVVLQRQEYREDKSVPLEVVRDMYFRQQEVQADEADFIMHYDGVRGGNLSGRICFA